MSLALARPKALKCRKGAVTVADAARDESKDSVGQGLSWGKQGCGFPARKGAKEC